jgi:8-oxo-dGTP pyrophosphatase MutT (NUDIX family)
MSQPFEDLPAQLRQKLRDRPVNIHTEWEARPAAVLLPLYKSQDEWHLLFTRRTDNVESHRGQVSFPGGVIESQDDGPIQAALREAEEEIGLLEKDVTILGTLDALLTVTQFIISPVVGIMPWPYPLQPNREEVASVFGVPLSWLADPSNLEIQEREPIMPGPIIPVHFFKPYQDEVIWGATARITLSFLSVIKDFTRSKE